MRPASNESSEDYLEAILILSKVKPVVRSVDIAEEMGFKKSSISVAMKNLRERGMITITPEGYIELTEAGSAIAVSVYERHQFFTDWLTQIGVPKEIARQDACRIEHVLSPQSFRAIKEAIGRESES